MATVGLALESANVVGYAQTSLRTGAKPAGACFLPITGNTINLQDITVSGYEKAEGYGEGDIYVQTLTPGGTTIKSYTWLDIPADPDEEESVAMYGWYDDDEGVIGNLTMAAGEGLYAYGPNTSFGLQSAGQVPTSDIAVVLRTGAKCIVNPTPQIVALNGTEKTGWNGVVVSGYNIEEGYGEGDIYVQTLTPGGTTIKSYTWLDIPADPEDEESVAMYGWYDDDEGVLTDLTLNPGEGIYAYGPNANFSIVFPGVKL